MHNKAQCDISTSRWKLISYQPTPADLFQTKSKFHEIERNFILQWMRHQPEQRPEESKSKQWGDGNGKCVTQSDLERLTCSGPPWAPRWPGSWTWLSWWSPAGLWHDRARRGRASPWSGTAGSPGSREPPSEEQSHGVKHTERSGMQGGGQRWSRFIQRKTQARGWIQTRASLSLRWRVWSKRVWKFQCVIFVLIYYFWRKIIKYHKLFLERFSYICK